MAEDPKGGSPSKSSLWLWLLPLVVAGLFLAGAAWAVIVRVRGPGVELTYRIPREVAKEMGDAARRRVRSISPRFQATADGETLLLTLWGATPETVTRVKRLMSVQGQLRLTPAAPLDVQEKFNQDKAVPAGYMVVKNTTGRGLGGEYEAYKSEMLVQKKAAIEGRHIAQAEPQEEVVLGGKRWVTAFELTAEGAKLFDETAVTLYRLRPTGLIAVLLDGELKSAPSVQSPSFRGRGLISGAKNKEEATELAIILRTGALPVKLGEPESEKSFGPKK